MKKKTIKQRLDEQEEVIKKALIDGLTQRAIAEKLDVRADNIEYWIRTKYYEGTDWVKPFTRRGKISNAEKLERHSEKIKRLLILGLTQEEIAQKLDVFQYDISKWVKKQHKTGVKWIKPFTRQKTDWGKRLDENKELIIKMIWAGYTFKAISKKFECPISPFMKWLLIVK